MSVIGSNVLAGASGSAGEYQIDRSLRFNDDDSAYLNRTPSSAGNRKTWTWSGWLKRSTLTGTQNFFSTNPTSGATDTNSFRLRFTSANTLAILHQTGYSIITSAVFRDPSSWLHVVLALDTTQSTVSDRLKLYINGGLVTAYGTDNRSTFITQNSDQGINLAQEHRIGNDQDGTSEPFDGYLADVHFIDGQALAATDFGEYDDNNVWQPIEYAGTYGTNGFKLDFSNNNSTTTIAEDSSGNNNDFTANNLSVASGAGNDSLIDTPTNYTATSSNNGGNYATMSPVGRTDSVYFTENGNLVCGNSSVPSGSSGSRGFIPSTIGFKTGKWYAEVQTTAASDGDVDFAVGIFPATSTGYYSTSGHYALRPTGHLYSPAGVHQSYGTGAWTDSDIIGIAVDMDSSTKTIQWFKNGTAIASALTITDKEYFFGYGSDGGGSGRTYRATWNFGQRPFAYTPPTGHKSLCTQNLPDPTIADGSTAMDVSLWTGNSTARDITGLNMSPDLVWLKKRNSATQSNHQLFDAVRGATKALVPNDSQGEQTETTQLTAFNSDGFSLGGSPFANGTGDTYVAWAWDAGANSNKTYTVKVVSDSGNKYRFDDFGTSAVTLDLEEGSTYVFDQSDSSNSGHPLRFSTTSDGTHGGGSEYTTGVTTTGTPGSAGASTTIVVASGAPTLYYYCSVHSGMGGQADTNSTAGASNFDGSIQSTVKTNPEAGFSIVSYVGTGNNDTVGHGLNAAPEFMLTKNRTDAIDWDAYHVATGESKYLVLNGTNAAASSSWMQNTAPTNSVWSVASGSYAFNRSNTNIIAYCFAPVEGYSAFGSYTGNGSSSDGPFVYLGFRPAYVLFRNTGAGQYWGIYDSARDTYNGAEKYLRAEASDAEGSGGSDHVDFLSNGFKLRSAFGFNNGSGATIIYAAFAEHPFKTARAR